MELEETDNDKIVTPHYSLQVFLDKNKEKKNNHKKYNVQSAPEVAIVWDNQDNQE